MVRMNACPLNVGKLRGVRDSSGRSHFVRPLNFDVQFKTRDGEGSLGRFRLQGSYWTSPDLVDTPDEGALREAMLEILPQENLATWLSTWLSQVEAWVSFQGIWEMIPNSTTCHPCARILVSPM